MDDLRLTLDQRETLLDHLLKKGIALAHDCGGTLACASCRVVVREGLELLGAASEEEIDMLDRAGAAAPGARLACQVKGTGEMAIEIPGPEAPAHAAMLSISVSERAAHYFAAQLAKHPGAVAVRVAVEPSGCSGFSYRIDPAAAIRENDTVFDRDGVCVIVDPGSLPFLHGCTLDVVQEGLSRRLRFDNPNARQSCGESFSITSAP